jgi:O-antigen/teichoic acid export membrane protein
MFVTTRLYVHWLGVRTYGIFAIVTSTLALAGVLRLGTTEATVKYVAEYRRSARSDELAGVVGGTLLIYAAISGVGTVALWTSARWMAGTLLKLSGGDFERGVGALRAAALGFPATLLLSAASSVFAGYERYDRATLVNSGATTLSSAAGVAALWAGGDVVTLTRATILALWLGALAATIYSWTWIGLRNTSIAACKRGFLRVFSFSMYSSLNTLGSAIFTTGDRLLVGMVLGPEAVSYYSVASSVSSRVYTVTISVTQALLPRFSNARASGSSSLGERRMFYSAMAFTLILCAFLGTMLIGAGKPLLRMWLGASFAEATMPILTVSTVAYALLSCNLIPYYYLNAVGLPRVPAAWYLIAGCAELVGILVLGRSLGLTGVLASVAAFPCILTGVAVVAMRRVGGEDGEPTQIARLAISSATVCVAAGILSRVIASAVSARSSDIGGATAAVLTSLLFWIATATWLRRSGGLTILEPLWKLVDQRIPWWRQWLLPA